MTNSLVMQVVMQGPPEFISPTDLSKGLQAEDPLSPAKTLNAYATVPINITFVAGDPNPGDAVRIFIKDEPGVPLYATVCSS